MSTGPVSSDNPSPHGETPLCAYRDGDNSEPCLVEADWLVVRNGDEANGFEACSRHLQSLVKDTSEFVVYPIIKPGTQEDSDADARDPALDVAGEGPSLYSLPTNERFTCPRRVQMTDGYTEPNMDFWEHRGFEHFQRCSFCGSVRADDAIGLIRTGWKIVETDRNFKFLIVPVAGDSEYYQGKVYKFYTQHLESESQRTWFRRSRSAKPQQAYMYRIRASHR